MKNVICGLSFCILFCSCNNDSCIDKGVLFDRLHDSCQKYGNKTQGYILEGKTDSAYYFEGQFEAYYEFEHSILNEIKNIK